MLGWKREFYLHESPALSALIVDRGWDGRAETQPALYAAQLFRRYLVDAGVSVRGPAQTGVAHADADGARLRRTRRRSPRSSASWTLCSDNFTAEMLLKQVGAVQRGAGTAGAGAAETRELLTAAGVPLAGVRIVDGSGLSSIDRWTAAGLADVLRQMWLDPDLRPYITASLPVAGVSGTLRYRMRHGPAYGFVRAKTGHDRQLRRRSRDSSATATSSRSSRTGARSSSRPPHADAGRFRRRCSRARRRAGA